MKNSEKDRYFILSPWFIGSLMGIVSLGFYLIPNKIYSYYIREPADLYLNYKAMIYISLSTIAFTVFGKIGFRIRNPKVISNNKVSAFTIGNITTVIIVLLVINLLYVIYTIGPSNILAIYANGDSQNGNYFKLQLSQAISNGKLGWISDLSIALIVWSFWTILGQRNRMLYLKIIISILLYSVNSIISVSRDNIISLVVMLICVYLGYVIRNGKLNFRKIFLIASTFIVFFGATFSLIGLARSSNITSVSYEITKQFMGYFPASYNRFAYVLDNRLEYPNSGWGYYSTQFIWDVPFISGGLDIYGFGRDLGIPLPKSSQENWRNQFVAVQQSGLNPSYIWTTIFGFTFSDFGYFGIMYFIIYGFISGIVFREFKRGDLLVLSCIHFCFLL
ncbi:oligosaccharide repeat unit polymerase [Deinococcus sp. KNUC1210]|uniref:O-antigen polymerase n=1 Tax=Deinococcus sp. KNUC1210 TaxID=2917691 RepID=UPI001EF146B4|nr:O-antigen polymerase [Deinococcus sp. KNUC1210]ULH15298.1 oligosaccharide repeat unit polymerase [Deinococcus sp. KNUC1210]